MSFNRGAAFLLLASSALVGLSGLAITACSSSTTSTGDTTTDSGTDAKPATRPDSGTVVDPDAGQTAQQCYDACLNAAPPTAKAAYTAVDDCWAANCNDPCINGSGTFTPPDAGDDGGDAGDAGTVADAGGLCGTAIGSGQDMACDKCTTTFCCSQWSTCYNNADCSAIDDCLAQCP
jgi:hypothetical protein